MRIPGLASLKQQKQPDHATVSLAYHELVADGLALESLLAQLDNLSNVEVILHNAEAYRKQSGCAASLESITGCSVSLESIVDNIKEFFVKLWNMLKNLFSKAKDILSSRKEFVQVDKENGSKTVSAISAKEFMRAVGSLTVITGHLTDLLKNITNDPKQTVIRNVQTLSIALNANKWIAKTEGDYPSPPSLESTTGTLKDLGWVDFKAAHVDEMIDSLNAAISKASELFSSSDVAIANIKVQEDSVVDRERVAELKDAIVFASHIGRAIIGHSNEIIRAYNHIVAVNVSGADKTSTKNA